MKLNLTKQQRMKIEAWIKKLEGWKKDMLTNVNIREDQYIFLAGRIAGLGEMLEE